jgi:hypothetical protein
MANYISNVVLNDIAASAADLVVANGSLALNGWDTDGSPFIKVSTTDLKTATSESLASGESRKGILKSLVESVYVASVAYSVANSTTYSMVIGQQVGENYLSETISYTSDATATDAEIAAGLVAQINASQLQVTASGTVTPITITANAGYPLFSVLDSNNLTATNGMATYAPNGTAANAITAVIAPDGTAATAIAGTGTVTVTTAAAHLLVAGDIVTIASVATMTLSYLTTEGKVLTGQAGGTFRVASVPTATTFTLEGVTASGTNSGTITITAVNCCFVQTLAAQATITAGTQLTIAGVATATLDGGTGGTYRVGAALAGNQRFKLENAALSGTNSGTITITRKESASRGLGSALASVAGINSANTYAQIQLDGYNPVQESFMTFARKSSVNQLVYLNEGDADYNDLAYGIEKAIFGVSYFTPSLANPAFSSSKV